MRYFSARAAGAKLDTTTSVQRNFEAELFLNPQAVVCMVYVLFTCNTHSTCCHVAILAYNTQHA